MTLRHIAAPWMQFREIGRKFGGNEVLRLRELINACMRPWSAMNQSLCKPAVNFMPHRSGPNNLKLTFGPSSGLFRSSMSKSISSNGRALPFTSKVTRPRGSVPLRVRQQRPPAADPRSKSQLCLSALLSVIGEVRSLLRLSGSTVLQREGDVQTERHLTCPSASLPSPHSSGCRACRRH